MPGNPIRKAQDRTADDTVLIKFDIDLANTGCGLRNGGNGLDDVIIATVAAGGGEMQRYIDGCAQPHSIGKCVVFGCIGGLAE